MHCRLEDVAGTDDLLLRNNFFCNNCILILSLDPYPVKMFFCAANAQTDRFVKYE